MHVDIYFGNPLQYSCQYSLMDRGAWQAIVHAVTKSQTGLRTYMHESRKTMFTMIISFSCSTVFTKISKGWI